MTPSQAPVTIVDIRGTALSSNTTSDQLEAVVRDFTAKTVRFKDPRIRSAGGDGAVTMLRSLPTMILYDDKGLDIFDKITYCADYYLTNAEIDILKTNSAQMVADYVNEGDVFVELGAGAMRKTIYLLDAIRDSGKHVTYCAVDLARDSLTCSLAPLVQMYPSITFIGLFGTYNDSLDWTEKNIKASARKIYLWLGSSIGNFPRPAAHEFMRTFQERGMKGGDMFWVGVDRRNDPAIVGRAYNDSEGLSRDFSLNGLDNINSLFNAAIFDRRNFEFVSIYNEVEGRHEAYFESLIDQKIESTMAPVFAVQLAKGELISFEYSYKYNQAEINDLASASVLSNLGKYTDSKELYDMHILSKNPITFTTTTTSTLLDQCEELWRATDVVTTQIIPPSRYLTKPIDLRHPYIFYLGHLAAFWDIQVSRSLRRAPVGSELYCAIFERGIDPNLDDPSQCHDHSAVPDEWPSYLEIYTYRDQVREMIRGVLKSGDLSKRVLRVLNMCYEHDAMHVETLLYMAMQDNDNHITFLPRPVRTSRAGAPLPKASWIPMQGGPLALGHNDTESADLTTSDPTPFGWDNENPRTHRTLPPFAIQHRPVTVSEYHTFLQSTSFREDLCPASWILVEEGWQVRSLYGPVTQSEAGGWPVSVSNYQAQCYADAHGAVLPTEEQLVYARSIVPPTTTQEEVQNHSFRSFTPANVSPSSSHFTGAVGDGWELTSTLFAPFEGYVRSELYPGYSADFFDELHYVVLGGSWATAPRIANRKSFRNWYQGKYQYMFSKFRLVKK